MQNSRKHQSERKGRNLQPQNNDVFRLLTNPEFALSKNTQPISIEKKEDRQAIRNLFSPKTHNVKALNHTLHDEMLRQQKQSLNISYDFKNSMVGKNGDLDVALTLSNVRRNMAQLPAGGKYTRNHRFIQSLDTSTKINLLRGTNNLMPNDEAYKEAVIHQSISENHIANEREFPVDSELVSMRSQEGIFFKPDLIKTETREGKLKIHVKKGKYNALSPFMPSTKSSYAQSPTVPVTRGRQSAQD